MEWILFGFLVLWFILQAWLLPRLGIPTCCCAVPDSRRRPRQAPEAAKQPAINEEHAQ
jgi:hypothetical protein